MKCFLLILLLLLCVTGQAEEVDMEPIFGFAQEFEAEGMVRQVYEDALSGASFGMNEVLTYMREMILQIFRDMTGSGVSAIAPALLLGMLRVCLHDRNGSADSLCFLMNLMLILAFTNLAASALTSADDCIRSVKRFTDVAAPGTAALIAAMGMNGTAALVSPAAALAGGLSGDLFLGFGLKICRLALCTAAAGNLSEYIDLSGFTAILRKTANWGVGLVTTFFTTMITLQGTVTESLDGVGMRTAKFAVDSASPVIGNGVSDAWESYISGMIVTKNALGVSGIAALLAAVLRPVLYCVSAMFLLNLLGAVLELFGEKLTGRAAKQIADICQMCLSLATGSIVIATVLLGAAMGAGKNIVG